MKLAILLSFIVISLLLVSVVYAQDMCEVTSDCSAGQICVDEVCTAETVVVSDFKDITIGDKTYSIPVTPSSTETSEEGSGCQATDTGVIYGDNVFTDFVTTENGALTATVYECADDNKNFKAVKSLVVVPKTEEPTLIKDEPEESILQSFKIESSEIPLETTPEALLLNMIAMSDVQPLPLFMHLMGALNIPIAFFEEIGQFGAASCKPKELKLIVGPKHTELGIVRLKAEVEGNPRDCEIDEKAKGTFEFTITDKEGVTESYTLNRHAESKAGDNVGTSLFKEKLYNKYHFSPSANQFLKEITDPQNIEQGNCPFDGEQYCENAKFLTINPNLKLKSYISKTGFSTGIKYGYKQLSWYEEINEYYLEVLNVIMINMVGSVTSQEKYYFPELYFIANNELEYDFPILPLVFVTENIETATIKDERITTVSGGGKSCWVKWRFTADYKEKGEGNFNVKNLQPSMKEVSPEVQIVEQKCESIPR